MPDKIITKLAVEGETYTLKDQALTDNVANNYYTKTETDNRIGKGSLIIQKNGNDLPVNYGNEETKQSFGANDTDACIVNVQVPTQTSELNNNSGFITNQVNDLANYYDKDTVEQKLSQLETNIDWKEAVNTYNDIATTYPNPVDGWTVNVKDTDYTYRYDGTNWVAISANAIPNATTSVNGLMTTTQVTKLNGIAEGAEVNVQSDWNQSDSTADDYIKNKPTIPTYGNAVSKTGNVVNVLYDNGTWGIGKNQNNQLCINGKFVKQVENLDTYQGAEGEIVEYIGATNDKYTNGHIYKKTAGESITIPSGTPFIESFASNTAARYESSSYMSQTEINNLISSYKFPFVYQEDVSNTIQCWRTNYNSHAYYLGSGTPQVGEYVIYSSSGTSWQIASIDGDTMYADFAGGSLEIYLNQPLNNLTQALYKDSDNNELILLSNGNLANCACFDNTNNVCYGSSNISSFYNPNTSGTVITEYTWTDVYPISTSELINDAGFITALVNNLTNYYTKTESDNTFAPISHTHSSSQITGLSTVATTGNYNDLSNKPDLSVYIKPETDSQTQETYVNIPNDTSIQGDAIVHGETFATDFTIVDPNYSLQPVSVKSKLSEINGKADETTSFTEASTRTNIASGDTVTSIWGKIKKWFSDLKAVAFSGSYNDLTDKPDLNFKKQRDLNSYQGTENEIVQHIGSTSNGYVNGYVYKRVNVHSLTYNGATYNYVGETLNNATWKLYKVTQVGINYVVPQTATINDNFWVVDNFTDLNVVVSGGLAHIFEIDDIGSNEEETAIDFEGHFLGTTITLHLHSPFSEIINTSKALIYKNSNNYLYCDPSFKFFASSITNNNAKVIPFDGTINDNYAWQRINVQPQQLSLESNKVKYTLSDGTTKLTLAQESDLANVAFTGNYNDLLNIHSFANADGISTARYFKVATYQHSGDTQTSLHLFVSSYHTPDTYGILDISVRWLSGDNSPYTFFARWLVKTTDTTLENFILTRKRSNNETTLALYVKEINWMNIHFTKIVEHDWIGATNNWRLQSGAGINSIPSDEIQQVSTIRTS